MTGNTDHVHFRSLFVDSEVPVEKGEGLQQKESEGGTHEAAEVESEEKRCTVVGEKGGEDVENKGDEKDGEDEEEGAVF